MPDKHPTPDNIPEYSVSALSAAVKKTLEGRFEQVRVRGELGRIATPDSGHIYMDLKDDKSVLAAVVWKNTLPKLAIKPEAGLEVICTGKITSFARQSRYQLVIEKMQPAGVGALMALLEKRRQELAKEGLFAPERKKPIPFLPDVIGVITSPSGAVIRDILHRLEERFPRHVLVWPVRVQGEGCGEEVARAIAGFNALQADSPVPRPDVLIVARGGGSVEDLWGFNEEIVVRAAAQSDIPLIAAIGHETDTTLIDYAADLRAPTPTAAAEKAVPVRADLQMQVRELAGRSRHGQLRLLARHAGRLEGLARGLPKRRDLLAWPAKMLTHVKDRMRQGMQQAMQAHHSHLARLSAGLGIQPVRQHMARRQQQLTGLQHRLRLAHERLHILANHRLEAAARQLDLLSHESILSRGFALLLDAEGQPVRRLAQIPPGSVFKAQLAGRQSFTAQVKAHQSKRAGVAKQQAKKYDKK